jgi:hypothetical protein
MGGLPIEENYVRFEVFAAVNMKNAVTSHKTKFFVVTAVKTSNTT